MELLWLAGAALVIAMALTLLGLLLCVGAVIREIFKGVWGS